MKTEKKWDQTDRRLFRLQLAFFIGILLSFLFADMALFGQSCEKLRPDVLRLHILANSDSVFDQETKLLVRDRILERLGGFFEPASNQLDSKKRIQSHLGDISVIASEALAERGLDMPVRASLCNMYFDTREYGEYTLPAGMYDAVRVTLGEGKGHNWWCVLYPPVCVPAAVPEPSPTLDELETLDGQPLLRPKLAIVEAFESLRRPSGKERICKKIQLPESSRNITPSTTDMPA